MRTKHLQLLLAATLVIGLVSCKKLKDLFEEEEDPFDCTNLVALKITAQPNPVISGNSFQLKLNETHTGSTYNWTGPNGWTSSSPEPTITNALSSHRGKYTVEEVTMYGCRIGATSDSIVVNTGTPPCTPTNNTTTIQSAGTVTYSTGMRGNPTGGVYRFTANGNNGDVTIEFPGNERPVAGTYNVTSGSDFRTGDVRVEFTAISAWWPASSGKVFVTVTNNKIKAIFCNLPVSNSTWGTSSTASGHLTEF